MCKVMYVTTPVKIPSCRTKYLFGITILLAVGGFLINNGVIELNLFGTNPLKQLQLYRKTNKYPGASIINTEGCMIPVLDPLDDFFSEYPYDMIQCPNATFALLAKNRTSIWLRFEENVLKFYNITNKNNVTCCYRGFYRPVAIDDITSVLIDNGVKYEPCITFNDTIVIQHEFVRVNCSFEFNKIYEQFFLSVLMKNFTIHDGKNEMVDKTGYNVLIVGIDNVSRLNLHRTMANTVNYLNKRGAVEMLGYNKVGVSTFHNLVPMLMGIKKTELNKTCYLHSKATFDNCPFVWEWYRQAGYYTAFMEDATWHSTFNFKKCGFINAPTDYYTRTFFHEAEKWVGTNERMCMHDIYFYKVILDYIEEITWRLNSKRLFGLFWESVMSYNKLKYPMRTDDDYVRMFEHLEASGYLNETFVFFVSDHGMRKGPISRTDQGRLEKNLPFLYLLTPPSFQTKYKRAYRNLKLNGERLTTPFDMHETLTDLINVKNIDDKTISARSAQSYALKRGISLFLSIPSNRTCDAADIDDPWCSCHQEILLLGLSNNDPMVNEAVTNLMVMINKKILSDTRCETLELSNILEAMGIYPKPEIPSWMEYKLIIETVPGHGMFEAVLRKFPEPQNWQLVREPIRLNRYEHQSQCVDEKSIKIFCFCSQNRRIRN